MPIFEKKNLVRNFSNFAFIFYVIRTLHPIFLHSTLGTLLQKDDRIEVNGEIESQLINSKLDGIFFQTDTSFSLKGDLTYETTNGEENLGVEGNYELGMVIRYQGEGRLCFLTTLFCPTKFVKSSYQFFEK